MGTIPEPQRIQTPGKLWAIVDGVRSAVSSNVLVQIEPPDALFYDYVLLEDVRMGNELPDIIDLFFQEVGTSKRYQLSVDMYHGGGSWGPV